MVKRKFVKWMGGSCGFTLVELLIVVSIIGILSGIVVSVINPNKIRGRARDGVRKNDIAVVKGALELYYAENNTYPASGTIPFGGAWTVGSVTYLRAVPQDPYYSQNSSYSYCYQKVGNGYVLCTKVEDSNSASVPSGAAPCGSIPVASAYCVQNPF